MSNKCPRCTKTVYMAEEVLGAGQHWHRQCFSCSVCKKGLDSTNLADKDGEIFCKSCHGRKFGIKGYGYGGGAGVLSMDGGSVSQVTTQQVTNQQTNQQVNKEEKKTLFCSECGVGNQTGRFCSECGKPIQIPSSPKSQSTSFATPTPNVTSPAMATRKRISPPSSPSSSTTSVSDSISKFHQRSGSVNQPRSGSVGARSLSLGGGDVCPRCGKNVYFAEKAIGAGKSWHRDCFKCKNCTKRLDSDTLQDRDGEIFCRGCYGKLFGPKGYGYGGGAGALQRTQ